MNLKSWEVSPLNKDRAAQLAEEYGLPFFLAMMLEIRGFRSRQQIEGLLGGGEAFSDPLLMKDMDRAVERIRRAIDNFEKIAVYGDYDADGVTSTAMVFTYLEAVGADVMYYIPQREGEGYGMNRHAVETLHSQDVKLIVTVDNGISSAEETALAGELGMDVVITDHHRPHGRLPEAAAVVDAYQEGDESPFKDFSGAGVALKLLIALEDGDAQGILEEYGDLAALGTIGDVVPVTGENRVIVRAGLKSISRGGRPGIAALLERCFSGREITATNLAFTVIPRLNATGRMGSPDRAVRLLCCDYEEEAAALAEEICGDNEERRRVEADILEEALRIIEGDPALEYSRVIVISGEGWHPGVIGIVAARITERYGKPCFVLSEEGETARGSGRSVEGFSLFDAVCSCAPLLERFGGHPMAAGATLRVENIPAFREGLNRYAAEHCPEMPAVRLGLDCRLNPASLNGDMPRALRRLEPFGSGNPQPLFGLFDMELREITPVGNGGHLRLSCCKNGTVLSCMRFGVRQEEFPFSTGNKLDLAVSLDLREYRGEEKLTVTVREIRLSGRGQEDLHAYRLYEKFRRREALSREEGAALAPTREDLAALYRKLSALGGRACGYEALLEGLKGFTWGKLLLCRDILEERGLVRWENGGEVFRAELLPTQGKVDIFASKVFAGLKQSIEEQGET